MARLTGEQLKDSYQSLVTIGDSIVPNPTSGQLENGLGNPITALGIGVTDVGSFTLSKGIKINNAKIWGYDDGSGIQIGGISTNINNIGATTTFSDDNYILSYSQNADSGVHSWETSTASGTAGATATMQERMRITGGGDISFRDTGGSEAFYWDADVARLGIGTDSPSNDLTINVGSSATDGLYIYGISGSKPTIYLGHDGSHGTDATIQSDGTDGNLKITPRSGYDTLFTSGNVGIGTDNPDSDLVVNGSSDVRINLKASDVRYGTIFADSGLVAVSSITSIPLVLGTNDTERMRIDSSGNVGIGTTNPSSYGGYSALTLNSSSNGGVIDFKIGDTRKGSVYNTANGELFVFDATSATAEISLQTNSTERMRINSSGNLLLKGTGTTSLLKFDSSSFGQIQSTGNTLYYDVDTQIFRNSAGTSEAMRILSGGGITFNGDTAAANALDDYEEGTWTPTLVSSGGSGSATYTSQLGTYTKIGRQVVVQFFISFQKNTLSGGTLQMQGFPFTSQANLYPESAILFDNLATALSNPLIQMGASSTIADLVQGNGGTSSHAGLSIDTYLGAGTMSLRGTITYFV